MSPKRTSELDDAALLARARERDPEAISKLVERLLPALRRWARGRLPAFARRESDEDDIVSDVITNALAHVDRLGPTSPGQLQAYLRQMINGRIRDQIRRASRSSRAPLDVSAQDPAISPLERAIGNEGIERYEAALARLKPADRQAIIARMELQNSYDEVARVLGKPNANAARVAVTRALARLIESMDPRRNVAVPAACVRSVADGEPIDWEQVERHAIGEGERRTVRHLRLVASVADVHRTVAPRPFFFRAAIPAPLTWNEKAKELGLSEPEQREVARFLAGIAPESSAKRRAGRTEAERHHRA
jgi:RNA polymerase sigma-70 factor (ECF subfamily)